MTCRRPLELIYSGLWTGFLGCQEPKPHKVYLAVCENPNLWSLWLPWWPGSKQVIFLRDFPSIQIESSKLQPVVIAFCFTVSPCFTKWILKLLEINVIVPPDSNTTFLRNISKLCGVIMLLIRLLNTQYCHQFMAYFRCNIPEGDMISPLWGLGLE